MVAEIALLALFPAPMEIIPSAIESFDRIESYSVTLDSKSRSSKEIIRYSYRKPGSVRMDFIEPHRGAVLVYDPGKGEARLRPFGFLKPLVLRLRPDSWLIRSSAGHTIDKSDIGTLLRNSLELQKNGAIEASEGGAAGGKDTYLVVIKGNAGVEVAGSGRIDLWLDKETLMPTRVFSYGPGGTLAEEVVMYDLVINPVFPEGFFELD